MEKLDIRGRTCPIPLFHTKRKLEGAQFKIDMIKPVIECNQCSYHGNIKFIQALHYVLPIIHCPQCDGTDVEILQGRDCTVKEMKF
ncbi:MAG: hypothetical protein GQ533_14345 [Methanosarcinaceae archaeon]|nr:hypothetical protein [Methanosarcinaceae archaeon]